MIHMPVPILLPQEQADFILSRLRIVRYDRQNILCRIPVAYAPEGTGGIVRNIARKRKFRCDWYGFQVLSIRCAS